MFCRDFAKICLKRYCFLIDLKKAKKWPNHFISGKLFQKRPNGNHNKNYEVLIEYLFGQYVS